MGYETRLYVGERLEIEAPNGSYISFQEFARFKMGKLGYGYGFTNRIGDSKIFTKPLDFHVDEPDIFTEEDYDKATEICTGKYRDYLKTDMYGDELRYGTAEDVIKGLMQIYIEDNYTPVLPVIAYLNSIKDIYKDLVVVMYGY